MTRLWRCVRALALLGSAWAALALAPLPPRCRLLLLPLPLYLLVAAGCFALATVGYRVATFHDCREAAAELRQHVGAARQDLRRRGLRL
ncbi:DPM3 mannosyltransferase, partial [Nothoprocta ornata]|nr:DPM3 mannosyltransferase [Nothoprocta ornata]